MKKMCAVLCVLCVLCGCAYADRMNPQYGEFYPRLTIIVESVDDVVTCRDSEGNLWQFFADPNEWEVGDICNLLMWNTDEDITLHEVIEVYYEGHVKDVAFFLWVMDWQ